MAEVVLFHHALGLTPGVTAFADDLRAAGHTVHTPDLFEGRTFGSAEAGVGHAREIGEVWRRLVGRDYPAMAGIGVARLWDVEATVEVQGFAVL